MEKGTRIQKVLSEQGIASRRKAEEWIEQGKIKVNGRPALLGQKINPNLRCRYHRRRKGIFPEEQPEVLYHAAQTAWICHHHER